MRNSGQDLYFTCSHALKKLVGMVGNSFAIYQGIADLCTVQYRDSEGVYVGLKEAAFCSLRCQLLMALHDNGENELCSKVIFVSVLFTKRNQNVKRKIKLRYKSTLSTSLPQLMLITNIAFHADFYSPFCICSRSFTRIQRLVSFCITREFHFILAILFTGKHNIDTVKILQKYPMKP